MRSHDCLVIQAWVKGIRKDSLQPEADIRGGNVANLLTVGIRTHSNTVKALELAFDQKSLRQVCENEKKAKRELGESVAQKLKHRLADLHAATTVKDIIVGNPRQLSGAPDHHFAVDLAEGRSIVFSANHADIPFLESGAVDWSRVSRIKILRIERDHG